MPPHVCGKENEWCCLTGSTDLFLSHALSSRLEYGGRHVSLFVFLFSFGREAACKVLYIRHVRPSVRMYQRPSAGGITLQFFTGDFMKI
jgi:hypothetical protein